MAFYLDLFTPETWEAFKAHGSSISGFRERQHVAASRIKPGDVFLCYVVRLMRWCGALEVRSGVFQDSTPIYANPDPFVLRFMVKPLVALELEQSIPTYQEEVWERLSLTRNIPMRRRGWAQLANLRQSLVSIPDEDAEYLLSQLQRQEHTPKAYPFSIEDKQRLSSSTVQTIERMVVVEVPADDHASSESTEEEESPQPHLRESYRMQAVLARIGIEMGFHIWVPRNDRQSILEQIDEHLHSQFLQRLPLSPHERQHIK